MNGQTMTTKKIAEQRETDKPTIPHLVRGNLISIKELALRLSVTESCVRKWLRKPEGSPIPYRIVGGTYKFDTVDLDDYLSRVYVPAAGDLR
jgi:hypothetical protein